VVADSTGGLLEQHAHVIDALGQATFTETRDDDLDYCSFELIDGELQPRLTPLSVRAAHHRLVCQLHRVIITMANVP
jgi:hypothetical protein